MQLLAGLIALHAWAAVHRPRRVRGSSGWRLAGWVVRSAIYARAVELGITRGVIILSTRPPP